MKYLLIVTFVVIASASNVNAQDVITTTAPAAPTKVATEIIASSINKVVKDSPFSAEGISESVQILPDGNKITRSTTTKMYRDSDGRFRREGSGGASSGAIVTGGFLPSLGFQDTISIYDPVEAVRYILTPSAKTARRFGNQNILSEGAVIVNGQPLGEAFKARIETEKSAVKKTETRIAANANVVVMGNVATTYNAGKTESLGTKAFEGVEAEGKRTITTIAAGTIGNEKPIEVVYERWYSKELDLTVYSRHYDPRFGEQLYRLTNISRSEPDRSLFTIPSDYKVVVEPALKVYRTKPE